MQVKVPKFLDVEDRVIAGLTWKQFTVLAGAIVTTLIANRLFASFLSIPIAIIAIGFGVAFAFVHVNQRPFSVFLFSVWRFNFNPRRYFWQKERPVAETSPKKTAEVSLPKHAPVPQSQDKLHEIALALDIQRKLRRPTP